MITIFEDHATLNGKQITLYEAACILARAMEKMNRALNVPYGYTHYDLAMSLKYNVIYAHVDGDPEDPS